MIGFPRIALAIELCLAIALSMIWLTILVRQLYARVWQKKHVQAPCYEETTQIIGVLQHIQLLYQTNPTSVTLADVQTQIASLQQAHGEQATIEAVIQQLVGEHLRQQTRRRLALRRQQKALVAA